MWTVTYEEDLLKSNYEFVLNEDIYFTSTNNVKLDNFVTDVVYWGGMNPWESCSSSLYELSLAGEFILKMSIFLWFLI
jgi:hypothetical protein